MRRTYSLPCVLLVSMFVACSETPGSPDGRVEDADSRRDDAAMDSVGTETSGVDATAVDSDAARDSAGALDAHGDQGRPSHILFTSTFSGVRVCDEDGECAASPLDESYYECGDSAVHLTGTDSVTGDSWPTRGVSPGDLPGDASRNYFNDVIDNKAPDCCASGCTATDLSQCHTLDIINTTQHDGSEGAVLQLFPLKDCSTASYSRLQYVMLPSRDAAPHDLSSFYFEVWLRFPSLSAALAETNDWSCITEIYMSSKWKLTIVVWHGPDGRPVIGMKNGSTSTAYRDNDITPEDGKWFKVRAWYKAHESDGHWKATYTCPDCSPPVPETVIKAWRGKTREGSETPIALTPLKTTNKGLEMHADDFAFGAYP